ncbi:hypothetical protein [Amycolatopsis sp. NPDC059021]|uniref:hypothetical protein n=1 Tax=Amycolatopsis sp. NPDC059021 TaxID=3346704 RepID=UPI00366F7983
MNNSFEEVDLGSGPIRNDDPVAALRMMPYVRSSVDEAELTLIESIMDRGWTWEQLGAIYGERSKQAMQQHYRRRGGQRSWPGMRPPQPEDTPPGQPDRDLGADPADAEAIRRAVTGLILSFRAADEALGHMSGAPWNQRDPDREAARRLRWTERLKDSLEELKEFITNQLPDGVPRVDDRPLVVGEHMRVHDDRLEIENGKVDQVRTGLDDTLARLQRHRDTLDRTIDGLQRRRAELA